MCNCVRTIHIAISVRIGMNYAIFVMHWNSISVYFATSVYIGISIYFDVHMVKATSMSILRRMRTISLQDAVETMCNKCRRFVYFFYNNYVKFV